MRIVHGHHAQVMRDTAESGPYHRSMINADGLPTRTLTIVLPESDWRALRAAEPDAVAWLQARIRERLAASGGASRPYAAPTPAPTESFWGDDDY